MSPRRCPWRRSALPRRPTVRFHCPPAVWALHPHLILGLVPRHWDVVVFLEGVRRDVRHSVYNHRRCRKLNRLTSIQSFAAVRCQGQILTLIGHNGLAFRCIPPQRSTQETGRAAQWNIAEAFIQERSRIRRVDRAGGNARQAHQHRQKHRHQNHSLAVVHRSPRLSIALCGVTRFSNVPAF